MIDMPGVRMSHMLLTKEQIELAKRWHAPAVARVILQRWKENKGYTFSLYDLPNGSGFVAVVDAGFRLGLWDSTQWASVYQCTKMTVPWAERAIEADRIFSESPEAEAIRKELLASFK